MGRYLLKRIVQIIPVLLILTLIIFCLVYVAGDPVALMLPPEAGEQAKAALREALGLDKPFYEQFFIYIGNLLRGDFGTSYQYNQRHFAALNRKFDVSLLGPDDLIPLTPEAAKLLAGPPTALSQERTEHSFLTTTVIKYRHTADRFSSSPSMEKPNITGTAKIRQMDTVR